MDKSAKKYVVSGLGVLSPLGVDNRSFWHALLNARSGVSELSKIDKSIFSTKIAAQLDMDPVVDYLGREGRNCSVNTQMSLACAKQIFGSRRVPVQKSCSWFDIGFWIGRPVYVAAGYGSVISSRR